MSAVDTPDVTAGKRPVWAELRDAIRGTGADYTKIPLKRAVFLLAAPMVLGLVLESHLRGGRHLLRRQARLLRGRDGASARAGARKPR